MNKKIVPSKTRQQELPNSPGNKILLLNTLDEHNYILVTYGNNEANFESDLRKTILSAVKKNLGTCFDHLDSLQT